MLTTTDKPHRLVGQFGAYLKEVLGLPPKVKKWEEQTRLPLYLRELYEFYRTRLLNAEILLMLAKSGAEETPATLAKHLLKVREKWDNDVVFVNSAASSLQRKRMVERKIPFVIPGNQMYLPMLGLDLREYFKKIHTTRNFLSPSTQVLVLEAIHHPKTDFHTPTETAKRFGYSTMTMTRAFDELDQAGLGEHTVRGKERCLRFPESGKALWDRARPLLKSPVKKRLFVLAPTVNGVKIHSGLSALAAYSNLAEPENPAYALDQNKRKSLLRDPKLKILDRPEPGITEIEIWSYAPEFFAPKGVVDRLSLYLSLEESGDERIEAAKHELLRGMKW